MHEYFESVSNEVTVSFIWNPAYFAEDTPKQENGNCGGIKLSGFRNKGTIDFSEN